jgi:hypothetical protein
MSLSRRTTRALRAVVTAALLCCGAARTSAQAEPAAAPAAAPAVVPDETPQPEPEPEPAISNLDFEGAVDASVTFAELAVPESGSLIPVGVGGYLALRYVPATFPFHLGFETGGAMFATGSSTGPSGTVYASRLSAWFFSPVVSFDLGALRVGAGLGMTLVMTRHSSTAGDSSSLGLAVSSNVGLAYRFFEKGPWATAVELRYQAIPGAKVHALALGLRVRFASITYR